MSSQDLKKVKERLQEMNENEVLNPIMPVPIYIQEAEDQKVWAEDDRKELLAHGLEAMFLDVLPERAGALRETQSNWIKEHKSRKEAENEWLDKAPIAFLMRNQLLGALGYAFRKHPDLMNNVRAIRDGGSRDDMIQDLNDIAVLGRANPELLKGINFNMTRLDLAAKTSDGMAELLARANGEGGKDPEALSLRNRAYTYLKEAIDEVRDCGKYVFANNPDRLKGYRSEFLHRKNKKSRDSEDI